MKTSDQILIVEDDLDDQELIKEALKELGVKNPLFFFDKGTKLIDFLREDKNTTFLILCDVNIPGKDGLETRKIIDDDIHLRRKSIPFVFYTTTATKKQVNEAYEMMIQGYIEKPHQFEDIKLTLRKVIDYWSICIHPNSWR